MKKTSKTMNELQSIDDIKKYIARSEKFLVEQKFNTHLFPKAVYFEVKGRMDALSWVLKLQPWIIEPKKEKTMNEITIDDFKPLKVAKNSFMRLVKEHKKTCNKSDCGIQLLAIMLALDKAGIKFSKKEMRLIS